ncbi:MAG: OsmC family peroxiredoxin [Dehalococcoidia bacterium]|nr:OsmC family peroxiredoxin [Dehalococcoidia bacterium]
MAEFSRSATVAWTGNLVQGAGQVSVASGVLRETPVSWPARVESPDGKTSPEELIAAAHASCYAMALSHTLSEAGHPPTRLDVTAEVSATLDASGLHVTSSALRVRGVVPGIDHAQFVEFAAKGEQACPVSGALRGSLSITVDAALAG